MILIAHITAINPSTLQPEVLRLTSAEDYFHDDHIYQPRITKSANFSQSLFSRGTTSGEVAVGIGQVEINNTDGSLDYLRSYGFNAQPVEIYLLKNKKEAPGPSNLYYRGVSFYCKIEFDSLTLYIMNRLQELDVNCSETTFEGSTQGPVGLEGDETVKGKIKPMLYGRCYNIGMYLLNPSLLIYGCNFDKNGNRKRVESIWSVRDKGGEILFHTDVSNAAALEAVTVPYGHYASCIAEGMIKLGTVPKGAVTADVYESSEERSSAPYVVRRMLEDIKGYQAGIDFDTLTLEQLHSANSCPVGIYITSSQTLLSAVTDLLDSIGGWIIPDGKGFVSFGRIGDLPNLQPVATIDSDVYKENSLARIPTGDESRNIPAFKVELQHTKNWNVIREGEALESLPANIRADLAADFKSDAVEDETVKKVHIQAVYLIYKTLLMGARSAGLRYGQSEFTGVQQSGSGGSFTFGEDSTLASGTGSYSAHQDLTMPNEIFKGDFRVIFELVSGTLKVAVEERAGSSTLSSLAAQSYSTPGEYSLDFTFSGVPGRYIRLILSASASTAVFRRLDIRERNPGLSPAQEAQRRLNIQKKMQERYTCELDLFSFKHVRVGDAVILKERNRFGLTNGKKFLVIGRDDDLDEESIALDIWSYVDDYSS